MPRFKSKPTEIEAEQWFYGKDVTGVFGETEPQEGGNGLSPQPAIAFVRTIHGHVTIIVEGDYVVTEPDGIHHYPCKPDIFEAKYEPI